MAVSSTIYRHADAFFWIRGSTSILWCLSFVWLEKWQLPQLLLTWRPTLPLISPGWCWSQPLMQNCSHVSAEAWRGIDSWVTGGMFHVFWLHLIACTWASWVEAGVSLGRSFSQPCSKLLPCPLQHIVKSLNFLVSLKISNLWRCYSVCNQRGKVSFLLVTHKNTNYETIFWLVSFVCLFVFILFSCSTSWPHPLFPSTPPTHCFSISLQERAGLSEISANTT